MNRKEALAVLTNNLPENWADLLQGLTLLARGQNNDISPLHCKHDYLMVMASPSSFSSEERDQLEEWGFSAHFGEDCFYSYKFGSA